MDTPPFSELGLPDYLLEAVLSLGFESPSEIQAAAIPPALEGHDLIGLSETGSGKTAAFALPALAKIDPTENETQALILCPTRELAVQVCEEVHRLGANMPDLRAIPVYGGAPIDRQIKALRKGTHLVVGTPGRLLDHLRRRSFNPSTITTVILDEADRMLDMGFREEMETLLEQLSPERQTLFFSATMNKGVSRLIERFGNKPRTIQIKRKTLTVDSIEQLSFEVRQRSKIEVLSRIIDMDQPKLSIVFCNTKRTVDDVTESLQNRGYSADKLHGDIAQGTRERTLKRFRDGGIELLIATDVAARGIDVDDVDIVFNYDLPQDHEDYVHRIGRTGRAGKTGRAISFIFGRDVYRLQNIERYTNQKIPRARIPSLEQVEGRLADQLFDSLRDRLEKKDYPDYSEQVDRLLEQGHTATDIASGLLSLFHESLDRQGEEIIEDNPEKAARQRKERPSDERRDERDGRERGEKRERRQHDPNQKMVTLFMNLGKSHHVSPKDIVGMLYREAGLPDGCIGHIKLFPKHTLVDVASEHASQAISGTKKTQLRGKKFILAEDRGRPEPGEKRNYGDRGDQRPDRDDRAPRKKSDKKNRPNKFQKSKGDFSFKDKKKKKNKKPRD